MYDHTVCARYTSGVVASKLTFRSDNPHGAKMASDPECNKLACEFLGVSEINLSYIIGSTRKVSDPTEVTPERS